MGSERREFGRVPIPMPVRFRVLGGFLGMWLDGLVQDLSAGGLRFISLQPVDQDAIIEFQLTLPGRMEPYSLTGRVLWVDSTRPDALEYGAVFIDVADRQRAFIEELVQFLSSRKGETVTAKERRRWPRIEQAFIVQYRCPARGETDWRTTPIKDLSMGGARLTTEHTYPPGSLLELQVQLPNLKPPIKLKGVVVWQRRVVHGSSMVEHGVNFTPLEPAVRQELANVVEFFLRKQKPAT